MYLSEGTASKLQMDQARAALYRDHVDCTCQYDGYLYPYLGIYLGCRRTLGGVTSTRVSPTSSDSFYGHLVTLDQYPGYRHEPAEDCWCRQGAPASKCASTTGTTCTRSNRDPASLTSVCRTSCLHLCQRW